MTYQPNYEHLVPWLAGKGENIFSQFGEDGLINATFDLIGEQHRTCFEVGAADGLFFSNTKRLRDNGWRALLIESIADQFEKLVENAPESVCVHETITPNNFAGLLQEFDNYDLGVIDIDGQDYWLWQSMQENPPRVMLVEFCPYVKEDFIPELDGKGQASLGPILDLGRSKSYQPVARTYCNVLFVLESEL